MRISRWLRNPWLQWSVALAAAFAVMLAFRARLGEAHIALTLLLIVLGGSASGGRWLGFSLSGAAFLLLNWFFVPPYGSLTVSDPLDWWILGAFLVTSVVAAQLLSHARAEAEESRRRADEIALLAAERVRLVADAEHAAALRESDRLKDALIASVSHDLRTPLTTIKALAHDLGALGDDRAITIEEEADRLNRFVADLLDISRLSSGTFPLRNELNAVDDIVGVVLQQTSGILDGRVLNVSLDPETPIIFTRCDLVHAVRVLVNLVENACKYSPHGSPIDLRVRQEQGVVLIAVEDRGAGIPEPERERIFAPFYRPAGVPSDAGSAGLGLAIARLMAEAQQGHLDYAPRDGGGSSFTFRLPAVQLEEVVSESL